ncbi:hypothetical protein GCM10023116_12550 [Kistimonas scapharcae]|uniref:Uncharacterized protein n=1 Tax=Kistimonas scapharcae TaxID=1036133 RepID=A0ABP8V176_9GAMM
MTYYHDFDVLMIIKQNCPCTTEAPECYTKNNAALYWYESLMRLSERGLIILDYRNNEVHLPDEVMNAFVEQQGYVAEAFLDSVEVLTTLSVPTITH